jgi:HNH endonuclease
VKLPFCVACGAKNDLQHHHLVTRKEGGSDDETNLITLCTACHYKLHQRQIDGTYNRQQRHLEGIKQAKAKGVKFGRKPKLSPYQRAEAIKRRASGETLASIAKSYAISMISRLQA